MSEHAAVRQMTGMLDGDATGTGAEQNEGQDHSGH
ncbi:hypothetical protein HDA32_004615 [Spinactinospora alkalitolerans]|uniref:Uncharacterized protein n=1 Tax=Spinactinospora alkalitolerans TaxID=687207 RepID=A0A852U1T8_9ACTN|nr:hypothetical protein [Spinactinospora alkalitolerans]